MFIQIELFNILVYMSSIKHRELSNKGNLTMEFDTVDIVVVRKQAKSRKKDWISQKLVFKTKGPYEVLDKATPISYWLRRSPFC